MKKRLLAPYHWSRSGWKPLLAGCGSTSENTES